MGSFTRPNFLPPSGITFLLPVFVHLPWSLLSICFLIVLWSTASFQSPMFNAFPLRPSLLVRRVLFVFFSGNELRVVPRVFSYLINAVNFCIWCARNDFRFRDVRPSGLVVLERVRARIRFYLPLFFRHFKSARRRYFVRQWGARRIVAFLKGGRLVVHV